MKEVILLNRVQAVLPFSIIHVLATIQEYSLKSEFTCNNYCQISLLFDINEFMKSVTIKPLSCITYNHL